MLDVLRGTCKITTGTLGASSSHPMLKCLLTSLLENILQIQDFILIMFLMIREGWYMCSGRMPRVGKIMLYLESLCPLTRRTSLISIT